MKLTNHDITPDTWKKIMNREQLRNLAKKHGIERGRNKHDTAVNLYKGYGRSDKWVSTFPVEIKF